MLQNHGTCRISSSSLAWTLVAALSTVGFVPSLVAAPLGWTHHDGRILELALGSDDAEISWRVVTETPLEGTLGSLAIGPDGLLWGASHDWPNPDRLVTIDPDGGEVTVLGELDTALWTDLDFGPDGRLWLVRGGELFEVGPDASTTPRPVGVSDLAAVAAFEGVLFGIGGDWSSGFRFLEIDPDAGSTVDLASLGGFELTGCFADEPASMSFDRDGGLWVAVTEIQGLCILPFFDTAWMRYPDPFEGTPEARRVLTAGGPTFAPSLAIAPSPLVAVEIPTLGGSGLVALGVAVLLLGGRVLRRRR